MDDTVHISEVGEFSEVDIEDVNSTYESAVSGSKLTMVDEPDGTYSLLDSDGNWVGCGVSAPQKIAGCLHAWHNSQNRRVTYCGKCGDCRGNQASFDGFMRQYAFKFNQMGVYFRLVGPLPDGEY